MYKIQILSGTQNIDEIFKYYKKIGVTKNKLLKENWGENIVFGLFIGICVSV